MVCAAAPILDLDEPALAALGVSAPGAKWRTLDRSTLGRYLAGHGRDISAELGFVELACEEGGPPVARGSK